MKAIHITDNDYIDNHANDISIWVENAMEEFTTSDYFEQLDYNEQDSCYFLLSVFFDYCYSYCLVGPTTLNENVISEIMLDVLPRKISAEKHVFEAFAPVMDQFLAWCENKKYIKNTLNLRKCILSKSSKMITLSQNSSVWGMTKSIIMGRFPIFNKNHDSENDIVYGATALYVEQTYYRESPKIGRNDLCNCGSGRKYKKCCLSS